ncbi:MAG: membrane protein insertase YidC [Fimbriimonas ginsengisoli]|nr:membrane protein insertase YidC [Fimbriimonas ginsengisoli]
MPGQHVAWTGQALFDHARETLSQANQRDLTYGILPGYDIIDFLVRMSGSRPGLSYWLACLILAVLVRAAVYPLSQKQYMWGRQMGQLQPLTREIKEKYKDDVQTQGLKTMELYREYGMNPYAGCLPALIQLPLFLTVYQFMLRYRFEFQKGTFLWINPSIDISNGWFAPNLGMEDKLLVIFYAITMVVSTLLMPITDPSNARQQRLISVGISVVFAASMLFGAFPVPAAFILYWTFTNILATAQAIRAYRSPLPPLVKVNSPTGGVYPAPSVKTGGWREKIMKAMEQQMEDQKRRQEDTGATKPELPTNGKVRTGKPATHKPKKRR